MIVRKENKLSNPIIIMEDEKELRKFYDLKLEMSMINMLV
jgi:hypothetical protein